MEERLVKDALDWLVDVKYKKAPPQVRTEIKKSLHHHVEQGISEGNELAVKAYVRSPSRASAAHRQRDYERGVSRGLDLGR
ncbi:MAG: hypothetical protein IJ228_10380 [Succinivibrio sp.]|nr:hypothetical protein [Succinivibrio sp.]